MYSATKMEETSTAFANENTVSSASDLLLYNTSNYSSQKDWESAFEETPKFTFVAVLSLLLMMVVTLSAMIGNTSILFVIVRSAQMRTQLAYVHLLNMCVTHLLAAVIVLTFSLAQFACRHWMLGLPFCKAHVFLGIFFSYSAILSMCFISIERYYSIRAPMHYAVHVTLGRTLFLISAQHILSAVVAVLPFFFEEAPEIDDWKCTLGDKGTQGFGRKYGYILGLFCFALPGFIVLIMYSLVYTVAKQAACRIHPSSKVSAANSPNGAAASPNSSGVWIVRVPLNSVAVKSVQPDAEGCYVSFPKTDIGINTHQSGPTTHSPAAETSSNIHWKAIKTLFLIIFAFLVFWGPHFSLKFYLARNGPVVGISDLQFFFQWLGWTSFAVNPLIYGGLNRNVREEVISQWARLRNCNRKEEIPEDDLELQGDNENFLQFLERTTVGPIGPVSYPQGIPSDTKRD